MVQWKPYDFYIMETKSKIIIGSFIGAFALISFIIGLTMLLESNLFVDDSDNIISYSNNNLTVTIKNDLGIELGELTLTSHISTDEIRIVPFNQEVIVIYYDFIGWDIYEDGLGKVYFIDMKTGKEIERDYYFVIWTSKLVEVNDYTEICDVLNITTNKTYDCRDVLSGSHFEEQWSWERLEKTDIPSKEVRIGLKTYVEQGDYIDAIWTIAGVPIEKHVEYEAGESNTRNTGIYPTDYSLGGQAANRAHGIKVTVGYENVFLTRVTINPTGTATEVYLMNDDGTAFLDNQSITNLNATFDYMLEGNESYYIIAGKPDGTWTTTRTDGFTFPDSMTEVDFVKGIQGVIGSWSEDAARAWEIHSIDLAPAVIVILANWNITGILNFSNGTGVNLGDIYAVYQSNNTVAKNTTSNGTGSWVLENMPNGTYIITAYDPTNASIDGDVEAHVVLGT